ncbi:uncharacterized protein SCHCODRAFT_02713745 [Schizophyllum commune H4-8]|uniref:uncharacterized protein n=1 Tax=Schizophyllum commune (strain H4-8 / FGSC 9210) TaxID=578458 RepID=UPI00215EF716|nr:uncharacterized protein SCHCODRAFT_02713745 [Schizophyllum commune H4-8]KAI5887743.1 hypothetical protein SCHCODRAFT_02713745 [Schizophyllum commune H4-8]
MLRTRTSRLDRTHPFCAGRPPVTCFLPSGGIFGTVLLEPIFITHPPIYPLGARTRRVHCHLPTQCIRCVCSGIPSRRARCTTVLSPSSQCSSIIRNLQSLITCCPCLVCVVLLIFTYLPRCT